jgi:hypothetical protein
MANSAREILRKMRQQQDIPRVMEIAKKIGLEILPTPGAEVNGQDD